MVGGAEQDLAVGKDMGRNEKREKDEKREKMKEKMKNTGTRERGAGYGQSVRPGHLLVIGR